MNREWLWDASGGQSKAHCFDDGADVSVCGGTQRKPEMQPVTDEQRNYGVRAHGLLCANCYKDVFDDMPSDARERRKEADRQHREAMRELQRRTKKEPYRDAYSRGVFRRD